MIRLDSSTLHAAVKSVMPAMGTGRSFPLVQQILVQGNGHLEVMATNLEMIAWRKLEVQSEQDFDFLFDGKMLQDVIKCASGEIALSVPEKGKLQVEDGSGSKDFSLPFEVADFPIEPFMMGDCLGYTEFTVKEVIETVNKAIGKAAKDDSRFNLNNLLFTEGKIITTDGHRLACTPAPWLPDGIKAMIPRDSMQRAIRSLKTVAKGNPCMTIDWHEKGCLIECQGLFIKIKLTEGEYPDYKKVIPQKTGDPCVFSKDALVKAIKQVKPLLAERNRCVKILVKDGKAILRVDHPDLGYGQTRVDYTGSPEMRSVGINAEYLIEALKAQGDSVKVQITTEKDPIMVNDEIIMPMRDAVRPDDIDKMLAVYTPQKLVIPELTEEQEHDWLADVDERYYIWKWNRKGSMFAGTWRVKVAA